MRKVEIIFILSSFVIVLGVVLFFLLIQITSHPKFCGNICHVMKPYYKSWETSSHNEVSCVECHIPPGITSEIRKKYEALAMVARYITGTYSTNPWTEIEDEACLRCHDKRLLAGKTLFKNVLFDHTPHLTEMRRKKKLRCTSCHSQIVQGAHIKVTETTCFLCHFKEVERIGEDIADCKLCHGAPEKKIFEAGFEFDHKDVERYRMDCIFCHSHSVEGNGEVPKERCFSCHNEPERIEKYDEIEYMHETHITNHKVECIACHQEIYHGKPRDIEAVVKTPCSTCHLKGHSPQKDLYMGIGGKGIPPMPSAMYIAGVRCEGCHFMEGDGIKTSGAFSCMNCHGASYYNIYKMWEESIKDKIKKTEKIIEEAKKILPKNSQKLNDALFNFELVKKGYAIHNIDYSQVLLEKAIEFVNEDLKERKIDKYFPLPWIKYRPERRICMRCHQGIEEKRGLIFNISFSHRTHLDEENLNCTECHRPHYEKPKGEVLKFDEKGCTSCHHKEKVRKDCILCHKNVYNKILKTKIGDFSHKLHIEENEFKCSDCHKKIEVDYKVCKDCHD
ncbi:MAG: NapC/NirT family cytochrome c [candidate division WOR-3 bacterium]